LILHRNGKDVKEMKVGEKKASGGESQVPGLGKQVSNEALDKL
jgi:hypothetical protein